MQLDLTDAELIFTDVNGVVQRPICSQGKMVKDDVEGDTPFRIEAVTDRLVKFDPGNYHLEVVYKDPEDPNFFTTDDFFLDVRGYAGDGAGIFSLEGECAVTPIRNTII